MSTSDGQDADTKPMPRLVVKLDSEPGVELLMKQGGTLSVQYCSVEYDDGTSTAGDRKARSQDLVLEIEKILQYIENNNRFRIFLSYLGISPKKLKGDKHAALIEQYRWPPGREEEGLGKLLREANYYASSLRAPE